MSENSYLQNLFSPFLTENDVTFEWVGTAFRKLAGVFRSYTGVK